MNGIIKKEQVTTIADFALHLLEHTNRLFRIERNLENIDRGINDFVANLNNDRTELLKRITMLEARVGEVEKMYIQSKKEFDSASQNDGIN